MFAIGNAIFTTTVLGSGAVTAATGELGESSLKNSARDRPVALNLFALKTTSSAVISRPLVGGRGSSFKLPRSLNVKVRPSGDISHDSAPSASTSPCTRSGNFAALYRTSRLYTHGACAEPTATP